ncbi:acetyl-CoA acetyltransferase [Parasphingopyxis lamellibrachiae]|uniref:Acetyl-CoA C-acetyltransferase n=1 Tax=Parasphingopyxis lamellibrachiae TaxID=680125 RepID=A0A3D9FGG8_9SPHN|nr:acetyl-CoA acetyltransferase [Parasphingopyxis lamellibrachiae]RED16627.1 acetyl-CoA C-acetyltransferase [Parasphingopyxis lamellibrachiae]
MTAIPDTTPVIIGVGQFAERPDDAGYRALSPMDLGGKALAAAIADSGASGDLAGAIDTIAAIRQFEISTPGAPVPFGKSNNPARSYGTRVGANPERAILEIVGGQGNQKLVGEFASDIAEGRSEVAAIVGSEAISTVLTLMAKGEKPDWSEEVEGSFEDRGFGMRGLLDKTLIAHGLGAPIPLYALFENARRAQRGTGLEAYRREIGALFAPFSEVAAANSYAAAPVVRSAEELATVTERNRIVAEPYTRMTVARDQVNQAAAIMIASAGKARALGIAEEKWVHIHAVTDAKELSVLERPDMATSPASVGSVGEALAIAGIGMDDITCLDLYSCFAIPVFNILDAFGVAPDDSRGLTLTGGLPFFGGAGNNYSAHAIAEAVQRLRADPDGHALIGANGGFMSKYATGIYAGRPADWTEMKRYRTLDDQPEKCPVVDSHSGSALVETYTIVPGKKGTVAAIVARTDDGARIVANAAPDDTDTLAVLQQGEPFGRKVTVREGGGRNFFVFAD